jgi:hypothetical protein
MIAADVVMAVVAVIAIDRVSPSRRTKPVEVAMPSAAFRGTPSAPAIAEKSVAVLPFLI